MYCKFKSLIVSRYLIAIVVAFLLSSFLGSSETHARQIKKKCGSLKYKTIRKSDAPLVTDEAQFQAEVNKYIGLPYRRGGTGKKGIDCSGLTKNFYSDVFGIELPHNSYQQSRTDSLEPVPLSQDSFETSDLLFFTGDSKNINHVGIYIGEGKFIHATSKRGVIISDLNESPYYQRHLVASRRIKSSVLAKAQDKLFATSISGKEILANQNISLIYMTPSQKQLGARIETFFEWDFAAADNMNIWPVNPLPGEVKTDLPMDVETWHGVRAAADFRPFTGMRITPSFSVMDSGSLPDKYRQLWKTYGIEATIAPTGSLWSLAFSLHSILNPADRTDYNITEGNDMGVRFIYRISDTLHFSLNGKWGEFGMEKTAQNAAELPSETQDLSFNIGLSF